MKRTMIAMTLAAAMTLVMAPAALADGYTASTAEHAGSFCFNAGPDNWTHCLRTSQFGNPSIQVKIFSEDGNTFLGTEQLVRSDIYNGHPCPQDNLETWDGPINVAGTDYFACHNFDTGRN